MSMPKPVMGRLPYTRMRGAGSRVYSMRATAAHSPQNSHVVVDTNPMEADAFAPRLPTIEASIYCIAMEDNWAITAGALR